MIETFAKAAMTRHNPAFNADPQRRACGQAGWAFTRILAGGPSAGLGGPVNLRDPD
jgi:hypothetical protein